MSVKYHKDLHLSQASNFILQSKTFTNISEPIYRLADLVEEVLFMNEIPENFKLEMLDTIKLIELLKEHHVKQLSRVSSVRMLNDLMDNNSVKFRSTMIAKAIKFQKDNINFEHPFDMEVEEYVSS